MLVKKGLRSRERLGVSASQLRLAVHRLRAFLKCDPECSDRAYAAVDGHLNGRPDSTKGEGKERLRAWEWLFACTMGLLVCVS